MTFCIEFYAHRHSLRIDISQWKKWCVNKSMADRCQAGKQWSFVLGRSLSCHIPGPLWQCPRVFPGMCNSFRSTPCPSFLMTFLESPLWTRVTSEALLMASPHCLYAALCSYQSKQSMCWFYQQRIEQTHNTR